MNKLENAIQNIRSGNKNEGLRQLLEIAKSDPKNEQAWLWLGMALPDPAKQADCLKRVLLINPENQQAANMLQKLEGEIAEADSQSPPAPVREEVKKPAQPEPPLPVQEKEQAPAESSRPSWAEPPKDPQTQPDPPPTKLSQTDRATAESKIQRALTMHMKGDTQKALKSFAQGLDINPNLANETFTRSVAAELTGLTSDQALEILMDPEDRKELLNPPKGKTKSSEKLTKSYEDPEPKKPKKPRSGLIQIWLSFFMMDEEFLAEEAEHSNLEDTLLSVLVFTIAAVFFFMINGFLQFRQFLTVFTELMAQQGEALPPLDFNIGIIFFVMLVGTLIMTPLSFIIGGGLQFLGARVFGGSGDFKSHIYLLALIQVPVTIVGGVVSLLANIPGIGFIGGLIGLGISIFALVITVRAIKAVHDLPTGRAVAGMILPPLILIFLGGCLLMIFGSALLSALVGAGVS